MLRNLSRTIYDILNVTSITDKATGGIYPLIAEQETKNFITYKFNSPTEATKDFRFDLSITISCYSNGYNKSLEMLDEVITVMSSKYGRLESLDSDYLDETNECVASATFNIKLTINT